MAIKRLDFRHVILLIAMVFLSLICGGYKTKAKNQEKNSLPQLKNSSLGQRVLIIVPHPDDETLATAGLIQQCLSQKKKVLVVILTCGDSFKEDAKAIFNAENPDAKDFQKLGLIRSQESRSAMKDLKLPASSLIFLGYPNGGLNTLWETNWDFNKLFLAVNGKDHSPYPFSYQKNAPYCGENLTRNLETIITKFKPTAVFFPDGEDEHCDHWAANAFVHYVLTKHNYSKKQYTYLVHSESFPSPQAYCPKQRLSPPSAFLRSDLSWQSLLLLKKEEQKKEIALKRYTSQKLVLQPFLDSFIRKNELFAVYRPLIVRHLKNAKPEFEASKMPHVVIRDPTNEAQLTILEGEADFKKVSFCIGEKKTYLALETRSPVSTEIVYVFRLRAFKDSKVNRLDIWIQNGNVYFPHLAKNSLIMKTASVKAKGNRLWVEIPSSAFLQARACMLSAVTFLGERRIDKTAWRCIKIKR